MPSIDKSVSTPRSIRSQQIKKDIYNAAMNLLREYGYEYITVKNICKLANVSTGSFYHYFKSKDDLMSNFFIEAYKKFSQEGKLTPCDNVMDNILQFFLLYSEFCQEQGLDFIRNFYTPFNKSMDMHQLFSGTENPRLPSMSDAERYISDAQDGGLLVKTITPQQLADDLCTIEKGCIYDWCVSGGNFNIRALVERLLRNYLSSYLVSR